MTRCWPEPRGRKAQTVKNFAALLLVLWIAGCSAAGETPEEAPACRLTLKPDAALSELARASANRWAAATGCELSVGPDGWLPVELSDQIIGEGSEVVLGRFGWDDDGDGLLKIRVDADLGAATQQHVLDHEIGHALGAKHQPDGLMQASAPMGAPITSSNLAAVCSGWHCTAFVPEAE